jgi:hypothetical protein
MLSRIQKKLYGPIALVCIALLLFACRHTSETEFNFHRCFSSRTTLCSMLLIIIKKHFLAYYTGAYQTVHILIKAPSSLANDVFSGGKHDKGGNAKN